MYCRIEHTYNRISRTHHPCFILSPSTNIDDYRNCEYYDQISDLQKEKIGVRRYINIKFVVREPFFVFAEFKNQENENTFFKNKFYLVYLKKKKRTCMYKIIFLK